MPPLPLCSSTHPWLTQLLRKADHGGAEAGYDGAYLCVRAYGERWEPSEAGAPSCCWGPPCERHVRAPPSPPLPTAGDTPVDVALHAALLPCPGSWGPLGAPQQCGSPLDAPAEERRGECSAAGECVCTGQWAKPVPTVFPGEAGGHAALCCSLSGGHSLPALPACARRRRFAVAPPVLAFVHRLPAPPSLLPPHPSGLGFEDCSTPVANISSEALAAGGTVTLEGETVEAEQ